MADVALTACAHHWMIAPAEGPTSDGECRLCGLTRTFSNSVEFSVWSSDGPERRAAFAERQALESAERATRR